MKFKIRISHYGFTMTELLLAMGISGIVMAGTYSAYHTPKIIRCPGTGCRHAAEPKNGYVLYGERNQNGRV